MTWFNRFRWTSKRSERSSNTADIDFVGLASAAPTALESELSFSVNPGGLHIMGFSLDPIHMVKINKSKQFC